MIVQKLRDGNACSSGSCKEILNHTAAVRKALFGTLFHIHLSNEHSRRAYGYLYDREFKSIFVVVLDAVGEIFHMTVLDGRSIRIIAF